MPHAFRIATPSDALTLHTLINSAFQIESFFKFEDRLTFAQLQGYFRTGVFLLAEESSDILGCIYVELRGQRAYLGLLAIDPAHQREGIGSALMAEAGRYAASAGCRFLDIRVVSVRPELIGVYARSGFAETGTEPFPEELPTRIPCHFITMSKSV